MLCHAQNNQFLFFFPFYLFPFPVFKLPAFCKKTFKIININCCFKLNNCNLLYTKLTTKEIPSIITTFSLMMMVMLLMMTMAIE